MKRVTKRQHDTIARAIRDTVQTALGLPDMAADLLQAQGVIVATKAGRMLFKVVDDSDIGMAPWLHCRVEHLDMDKAREAFDFDGGRFNRHSGKWNWMSLETDFERDGLAWALARIAL